MPGDPGVYQLIKDVGFPAAVAAFVLIRLEVLLRQIRDDQRDLLGILGARRARDRERGPDC